MKSYSLIIVIVLSCHTCLFAQGNKNVSKEKGAVISNIEARSSEWNEVSKSIWSYAEMGYLEEKSSALLQSKLEEAGFKIESGVADLPTAFTATYGSGKPVIGILAEFDALPGLAQDATPERKPIPDQKAGHACGHHLFGAGSMAAAVAVKEWMQKSGAKGTIKLFGTPAEEGGSGKVYMVREGVFKDTDVVLHWHPGDENDANPASSLANKSAKFRFKGISSHASASPEMGRSALDGVESMNYMINMMREHIPSDARVHYVITEGGKAPNVVPDFAEVFYYVRHRDRNVLNDIWQRIEKAAEGAAMGTGTKMEYEVIHGNYDLLPNETLSKLMFNNLKMVGGVQYNEGEVSFARKISESTGMQPKEFTVANIIQEFETGAISGGSTDVGDVSWAAPTAAVKTACWVPGTSAHTWQAVAAGGMSIGQKGMLVAAKTLALTALDIFKNPSIVKEAHKEFIEKRGADFEYNALLGNRKPPLDYRK
jgi:aminobenzoyl-glutamate utilization protein B